MFKTDPTITTAAYRRQTTRNKTDCVLPAAYVASQKYRVARGEFNERHGEENNTSKHKQQVSRNRTAQKTVRIPGGLSLRFALAGPGSVVRFSGNGKHAFPLQRPISFVMLHTNRRSKPLTHDYSPVDTRILDCTLRGWRVYDVDYVP